MNNKIGQCEGTVDHIVEDVSDEEECLKICQSTPKCRWFTFRRPSSPCILLSNCVTLDEVKNSISGERRCQVEQPTTTSPPTTTSAKPPKGKLPPDCKIKNFIFSISQNTLSLSDICDFL